MYVFIFIMSDLDNTNTKLPTEGPKHKRAKKSPRLQEKYGQKGQVDNLPTDSQPDPTETLDVSPPTSIAHKYLIFFIYLMFYFLEQKIVLKTKL